MGATVPQAGLLAAMVVATTAMAVTMVTMARANFEST